MFIHNPFRALNTFISARLNPLLYASIQLFILGIVAIRLLASGGDILSWLFSLCFILLFRHLELWYLWSRHLVSAFIEWLFHSLVALI